MFTWSIKDIISVYCCYFEVLGKVERADNSRDGTSRAEEHLRKLLCNAGKRLRNVPFAQIRTQLKPHVSGPRGQRGRLGSNHLLKQARDAGQDVDPLDDHQRHPEPLREQHLSARMRPDSDEVLHDLVQAFFDPFKHS